MSAGPSVESILAVFAGRMAGGADKVIAFAAGHDMFRFWPAPNARDVIAFFAAGITMMLGSIPQQDVFQRVMSANSVRSATQGPVIGGIAYIFFAFVPMFLVTSSMLIMPQQTAQLLAGDGPLAQHILPTLVLQKMPFVMQVIFFGALLSAIKSTASATLLAPSVTFTENIWRQFRPAGADRRNLRAMRVTVLVFSVAVLVYAIRMEGTSIYEMVSNAYQVPLVGAFVPLVCGLYWQRASTQGAVAAVVLGIAVWVLMLATPWGEVFPAQLAGLLASIAGMVIGSLAPQWLRNVHTPHRPLAVDGV